MTVTIRRPLQLDTEDPAQQNRALSLFTVGADTRATSWGVALILLLLTLAVFSTVMSFVPANGDDLAILSSVAHTQNPLSYFVGDWGLGNNIYRPLHSISIWLVYHVFGVSSAPNQFINLCLHLLVGYLLFRVLYKVTGRGVLSGLLAAVALISNYTVSAASWISDRPTLMVAVLLLLLIQHLVSVDVEAREPSVFYIAVLSALAFLSKESGLVVPLLAIIAAIRLKTRSGTRWTIVLACVAVLLLYGVARVAVFGPHATTYSEKGYLFGFTYYDDWAQLQFPLKQLAVADIVVKNVLAPILPIFSNLGAVLSPQDLVKSSPIWLPTVLLVALAVRKHLSRVQIYALLILVLNAAAYFVEFRYRGLYLAELAVCLFVAGSIRPNDLRLRKIAVVSGLATLLLAFSIFSVSQTLGTTLVQGYEELNRYNLARVVTRFETENQAKASAAIDPQIVRQVLDRYRVPDNP